MLCGVTSGASTYTRPRLYFARLTLLLRAAAMASVAPPPQQPQLYAVLSARAAAALDADLMGGGGGGGGGGGPFALEQLVELAGLAVAQATQRSSCAGAPRRRVLVACGPGNNGADGLVAARHLAAFGHDVTVSYPRRASSAPPPPFFALLERQLALVGVEVLAEWPEAFSAPGALRQRFDVAVDAVFGFSYSGGAPRPPFDRVLADLAREAEFVVAPDDNGAESEASVGRDGTCTGGGSGGGGSGVGGGGGDDGLPRRSARRSGGGGLRVVSVDVPSGWPVDGGAAGVLRPSVLVSLSAPKPCAALFDALTPAAEGAGAADGSQHWLGGRFVPREVMARHGGSGAEALLARYEGDAQVVRLR